MAGNLEPVRLNEILETISAERGGVAEIHTAFSDFPAGVLAHYQFYKRIMLEEPLPLERIEREYLAIEVSQANACPYCIGHHTKAYESVGWELPEEKKAVLRDAARTLTLKPHESSCIAKVFREAGYSSAQ